MMTAQIQPHKSVLWQGALLGGIFDAMMRASTPEPAATRQWVRNHYVVNGGDGREGVITFAGGHWYPQGPVVAAFHDVHSRRIEKHGAEWTLDRFFLGCPAYERMLAEQAVLPYLQLEVRGSLEHRVTAAFWAEDDALVGADPWDVLYDDGVDLVKQEMIDGVEAKLDSFSSDYGATTEQLQFANSIFRRKTDRPPALIELTNDETSTLMATAIDDEAIQSSRQLFAELGVVVPQ